MLQKLASQYDLAELELTPGLNNFKACKTFREYTSSIFSLNRVMNDSMQNQRRGEQEQK